MLTSGRRTKELTAKRNNYDVTKREDGWAATRCGAERASYIGSTQKEAFERARELCITHGAVKCPCMD